MGDSRRRPIIGGNWKMNTDLTEARALAAALVDRIGDPGGVEVVICPPFTNLEAVHSLVAGTPLALGAQDVFWEQKGAFTGEISPLMLRSVGAEYVIVGHSERRHVLGESSEIVNRKAKAALAGGLKIILAVGETEEERYEDRTTVVLEDQLDRSLAGFLADELSGAVLAYEPVWAIGTGLTATPEQAEEAHEFIRAWIVDRFGEPAGDGLRIQYGGSVNAENAAELLGMPDIDGALVGGASLKPDDFAAIVVAQRLAAGL
jgi:triosephosphate isomerase (TIM)